MGCWEAAGACKLHKALPAGPGLHRPHLHSHGTPDRRRASPPEAAREARRAQGSERAEVCSGPQESGPLPLGPRTGTQRGGLPRSCICCSFCHPFENFTRLSHYEQTFHNSGAPAAAASATAAAAAAAPPPASGAAAAALLPLWAVSRRCSRMPVATLTFRLSTRV